MINIKGRYAGAGSALIAHKNKKCNRKIKPREKTDNKGKSALIAHNSEKIITFFKKRLDF